MDLIQFEGRTVAVIAPEDLEGLESERNHFRTGLEIILATEATQIKTIKDVARAYLCAGD